MKRPQIYAHVILWTLEDADIANAVVHFKMVDEFANSATPQLDIRNSSPFQPFRPWRLCGYWGIASLIVRHRCRTA
jgi:hypothetical protein